MKKLSLCALEFLAAFSLLAGSAHAQSYGTTPTPTPSPTPSGTTSVTTSATAMTGAELMGTQTVDLFSEALGALGGTLNVVGTRIQNNTIQNRPVISNILATLRGTLLTLRSTVVAFDNRARMLAAGTATTPGLPNTGGGGAAK